jgi:hypothetical protein
MSKRPAVLYLRSATHWDEDDKALKVQEAALTEFAQQSGYEVKRNLSGLWLSLP